jgi:hypothetical protein
MKSEYRLCQVVKRLKFENEQRRPFELKAKHFGMDRCAFTYFPFGYSLAQIV